jgi:hypothetical protein
MSDETATSPENPTSPPTGGEPRVRRISNPRIKKPAKTAPLAEVATDAHDSTLPTDSPKSSGFPDFSETADELTPRGDWPEPDAASSGTSSAQDNPKRKRRRKKGKGNGPQNTAVQTDGDSAPQPSVEPAETPSPNAQPPRHSQPPRLKLDPELLAKFAWKIYLSEVSEEGVALVGDNDAKELSRRCFRLAEIFMEEQARRR